MSARPMAAGAVLLLLTTAFAGAPAPEGERFPSRWKPREDGWIELSDGKGLEGWTGAPDHWKLKDGALVGYGANGIAFLVAREADWTDYTLALEVMLGTAGTAVVSHGTLSADLGAKAVRLGYPQQNWKTLARKPKGLTPRKWYAVALDVRGSHAEVRINGKPALVSDRHKPLAGAPAIEALGGGVAFRDVRLRLHETDPDYKAVALGEGYTEDPAKAKALAQEPKRPRTLGRGDHRLFDGRGLEGWQTAGEWSARNGEIVATAGQGRLAHAFVPATEGHSDYIIKARCRILRGSRRTRTGEYFLISFRQVRPGNFFCVRFPVEGIFEIGYYLDGRFGEVYRGVRKGAYNEWREIEITVRGGQLAMRVDALRGLPTWKLANFPKGAIGLGVTGGQAAFRDVRVRILR